LVEDNIVEDEFAWDLEDEKYEPESEICS